MKEAKKNIGLFGGTFNPVHFGHLRTAVEVMEGFPLDECVLIPAATPPHKATADMVDANARLEMIHLAVSEHPGLKVSEVELKRAGPSYTIDTVQYFRNKLPEDSRLFLIMGMDAFLEFDTWKSYRYLLENTALIVVSRPVAQPEQVEEKWQGLKGYLDKVFLGEYIARDNGSVFTHPRFLPIHAFDVSMLDISSSKIRHLIRQGQSARYLVPAKVFEYIQVQGLYL